MPVLTLQIPEELNAFYEREAQDRLTSKSAVVRAVLLDHVLQRRQAIEAASVQADVSENDEPEAET